MNRSHKINILTQLIQGKELCSGDFYASNTNQYFVGIKNAGIDLQETWTANKNNTGRHLERSLVREGDNVYRAVKHLMKLQGKPDNHQKNKHEI